MRPGKTGKRAAWTNIAQASTGSLVSTKKAPLQTTAHCSAANAPHRQEAVHGDPACGPDLVRVGSPRRHSARPRPFQAASAGLCVPGHVVRPAVRPGNRGVAIYGHGCGVNSSKAGSAAPPLLMRPPRDRLARHGPASTSSWSMPVLIRAYSPPSSLHLPLLAAASSAASCGTCVWIQETKRSQARCGRL